MVTAVITRTITMTALLLMSVNPASAQLFKNGPSVFNYNYIDAAYVDDDDADGVSLRFSANIRENYALQVGYTRVSEGQFSADSVTGGLAYHIESTKFPRTADWVFNLGFQSIDVEGDDDTGLNAGAGIRYAVNDLLEVNAAVNLTTAFDTDLSVYLAGFYEVATGISAFVEANIGDGSAIGIGARFYWR